MAKNKVHFDVAKVLAADVVDLLRPACMWIDWAGSLRRGCKYIGDIEIVAIPRPYLDMFGNPATGPTELDELVSGLYGGALSKDGPRYKQFSIRPGLWPAAIQVDLFLATRQNLGYILMLRTGPADFSHQMVTPKSRGGLKPDRYILRDGYVWDTLTGDSLVEIPDERTLFELWGMPVLDPARRIAKRVWGVA